MADGSLSRRDKIRLAVLLVAASLLSYANGLTGAFAYDDKAIVRDNPRIRSPRVASQILTTGYFGRPRGSGTNYRPVLLASFAVQWWVHGGRAAAFRVVNLLLHATATLLLAGLLLRAGFPLPQAAGAGLLFAVHPIHVEAVTSVVGRGETLAALFVLLFLSLLLRARQRAFRSSWWQYVLALCCYFLGTLTKESAAVAPALLFLLLFRMEEGSLLLRLRRALLRGLPLYAASAAVLCGVFLLRSWILGGYLQGGQTSIFELENPLASLRPLARGVAACTILFRYLGRIVFPVLLSADESAWSIPLPPVGSLLGIGAVLLLLLLGAAVFAIRTAPAAAFGTLFFVIAFLPASNLLFPIGTIFAERLAYLPSAGVCLLLASGILGSSPRFEEISRGRRTALFCVTLLFASRTVVRNTVWESDLVLFSNTVSTSPGSAKAYYNLAYTLAESGDHRAALARYIRATEIYPPYFDAWAGKGRMEKELGDLEQAEASYRHSLAAQPAYENGFFGLGIVREARGNWRGAEAAYAEGLRKNPGSLPLAFRLALARSRLAPQEAEKDWRRAIAIGPDSVAPRLGYAGWLLARGRRDEARRQAREVLRRHPASLETLRFVADVNARAGLRFAEGLARERIFRITRSEEDLRKLRRLEVR